MKVGMLRYPEKPPFLARTIAYICSHYNIDFFYFRPEDVDLTHKKINGSFLVNGKWVQKSTDFPDVIDNAPMRERDKILYSVLEEHSILTTRRIGSKKKIFNTLEKDGRFKDVLIPYKLIEDEVGIKLAIDEYKKVLLKPSRSNQGKNIYVIERSKNGFQVSTDSTTKSYSELAFTNLYNEVFANRLYICQPFIESKTKEGHPFDVRIHTRKNIDGKWATVKIYPKIGIGKSITSNISQGGGISAINSFLEAQFEDNWKDVKQRLNQLSRQFPPLFQSLYTFPIDALGIDIGIDKSGKLWLFEVNTFPGAMYLFAEDAEARVQYYRFCAKKAVQTS